MYRGYYNLRSADDEVTLTEYQINEIIKCSTDVEYFLRNYCYVHTRDNGMQLFPLRPRQQEELPVLNNEKMIKSDWYRQSGYTTLVMAYLLWKVLFTPNLACLYMIPKKELAYENFHEKVRLVYISLPFWMQRGVKEWTKQGIKLDNGSIFYARAASADNAMGIGWDYIFIDEFGWIKDKAMMEIVNSLFPCINASKKAHLILAQSHRFGRQTPANLLFWKNTTLPFYVSEFTWDQDERLDEKWAETEKSRIGYKNFEHQYCGKIQTSDPSIIEPPEQFGQWTVWKEGMLPNVKEYEKARYICTIVRFSRITGLPVGAPYTQILTADDNGMFYGLETHDGIFEKVVAWMPAPEIPGVLKDLYGV